MTVPALIDTSKIVGHVLNHPFIVSESGFWLWTAHATNLVLAGLIMVIFGPMIARQIATGDESEGTARFTTKNPFAHMIEVICLYLRDEMVRPLLHHRTDKFMPLLWGLFFFILINNLLGLVPILDAIHLFLPSMKASHSSFAGGTATQNIWVTGMLATFAFLLINGAGIKELGIGGYLKHLTAEAPFFVWPIIVPVEILGTFVKPFALAIRLFANMTAGHILLATLLALAGKGVEFIVNDGAIAVGGGTFLITFLGSIAIFFLEIFVAFIQAFIFFFLTTVFISLLSHHDEEHDEHHESAHDKVLDEGAEMTNDIPPSFA